MISIEYYKVESKEAKSKGNNIEGCYEKINYHSLVSEASAFKYPIYNQTDVQNFLLKVDVRERGAPWMFTTSSGHPTYV